MRAWIVGALLGAILVTGIPRAAAGGLALAESQSRYFPQTGHSIQGAFLAYWEAHGGLAQHGYPLTDELQEVSPLDGKTYTVQYFERSEFERHPELQPPYDVLLSQLGTIRYRLRYPEGAPKQQASRTNPVYITATGHTIGGLFRTYWEQHGAVMELGYPISDELQEVSDLDGRTYTVQYFERAVMEWHPENPPPYEVLLTQLGRFRRAVMVAKQAGGALASPPRIYSLRHSDANLWPNESGSVTQYYSTCGALPSGGALCQKPMVLSTQLHQAGSGFAVTFSASWENGSRSHSWLMHVSGDQASLVSESGDPLPPLPQ